MHACRSRDLTIAPLGGSSARCATTEVVGRPTSRSDDDDDDDDDDGGGGDDDVGGDGDDGGGGGAPGGGGWNGNIPSIGRGGLSDDEDDLEEMPLE